MRSSTGQHFVGLDHIRALAAFLVFAWHFLHGGGTGHPVPYEGAPALFPFAILDEGHTGVALFMALSGYLFAKLLNGQSVHYAAFFWNRLLRLAPLLVLVFILAGVQQIEFHNSTLSNYGLSILKGFVLPTWPNGGWSITVEMHFYLILPIILFFTKRWKFAPLLGVVLAIITRVAIFYIEGEVQPLSYLTIIGRIDQFLLGIAAFNYRDSFTKKHFLIALILTAFLYLVWLFDKYGGFFHIGETGSLGALFIIVPTIEGATYCSLVAYYDTSFRPPMRGLSKFISRIGVYSYSIYLLQGFVAHKISAFIDHDIMDISNFYFACLWSVIGFLPMVVIGQFSYRFIEAPFLRLRLPYLGGSAATREERRDVANRSIPVGGEKIPVPQSNP